VGQGACGLELRSGTTSLIAIQYDGASSLTIGGKTVALLPDRDEFSSVRLFIDGSIIEAFIDSKEAVTARCYTPAPGAIQVAWTGPGETRSSVEVSSITPISKDRLTS
jgi:hypothetical protein